MFGLKEALQECRRFKSLHQNASTCDSFAEKLSEMRMNENNHEIRDKLEEAITALTEAEVLYKAFLKKVVDAS